MMDKTVLDDFQDHNYTPVNISRVIAYRNGDKSKENNLNIVLIGIDENTKTNLTLLEGSYPNKNTEVLASITLKEENGVAVGDKIVLSSNDKEYVITGFSEEAKLNVSSVIYTDLNEASGIMMNFREQKNNPSSKSVDTTSGATKTPPKRISALILHDDIEITSETIYNDYDVLSVDQFIHELPGFFAQVLTFALMIGFLILISSIVLGVFMYIITMQKKETFGVMKIQGISNDYISRSVIAQTFLVSIIGIFFGLLLTLLSERILPYAVPFKSNYLFYLTISLAILVTSLFGSIFSVKRVKKVDPLEILG